MKHLTILVPDAQAGPNTISCIIGAYHIFTEANEYCRKIGKDHVFTIQLAGVAEQSTFVNGLLTIAPQVSISSVRKTDLIIVPAIAGNFKKGQEIGIYLQVYNSGIDQTTLRPSVDVQYVLLKDGKEVLTQPENWEGLSDSGQRLTLARLLPTDLMPLGEYEIKIVTKDRVGGQVVENKGKFTITQ